MRTWERTRVQAPCGSCNARLTVGTPVQVVTLTGAAVRLLRCEACADGPLDVEQLEAFDVAEEGRSRARDSQPVPVALSGATRPLFDGKAAAIGGEE